MADYAIHDTTLTDIANKIRKKDGTSALIDPADYADRINLMGMLEEKTQASASVCAFDDGADDVPTKSVKITIPASLSGVSSVVETQTGRNLFNEDWEIGGINDTTGLPNSDTNKIRSKTFSIIKGGTTCYVGAPKNIRVLFYASDESFISETANIQNSTFSVPSNCSLFKIRGTVDYGTTYNNDIMISYGNTASSYEPYQTPTQYTASLGRTIYGGQVDIVNGEGQDYALWVNLSDIAWTEDTNRAGVFYGSVSGRKTATADDPSPVIGCTCYDVNNVNVTTGIDNYISGARSYGGNIIFFRDSSFHGYTRAQVQEALQGEKVCVVSANPIDYTFTGQEVPTRLGYNAFWSDEGDTEVTYRSSGTIHQYPNGEEASF